MPKCCVLSLIPRVQVVTVLDDDVDAFAFANCLDVDSRSFAILQHDDWPVSPCPFANQDEKSANLFCNQIFFTIVREISIRSKDHALSSISFNCSFAAFSLPCW